MRTIAILFAVLWSSVSAATLSSFKSDLRYQTKLRSTSVLNDTALTSFCNRAIVFTSTDVGGVEYQWRVILTSGTKFYRIPDSVIQIFGASIVSNGITKSIKAYPPEFAEEDFKAGATLGAVQPGPNTDATPRAYQYWADTLQSIPVPIKTDSLYLKGFVRHPQITLDTATIKLKPQYQEAAMAYACYLTWRSLDEYEKADAWLASYKEIAQRLEKAQARKADMRAK